MVGIASKGQPQIGLLISFKGSRAIVRLSGAQREQLIACRELTILQKRPLLAISENYLPNNKDIRSHTLAGRDLIAGWRILSHETRTSKQTALALTFPDLADLLLSSDDPLHIGALWLWLNGDQPLFRRRRDQMVEARTPKDVQQIRLVRRNQKRRNKQRLGHIALLKQQSTLSTRQWNSLPSSLQKILQRLIYLADCTEHELLADREAIDLLNEIQVGISTKQLIHWLIEKGWRSPHILKGLQGTIWSKQFNNEVQAQAEQLICEHRDLICSNNTQRQDLTNLKAYTLDDAQTQEVDDAISLEIKQGKSWIWIHIADPAFLININSPLDNEAKNRATSLYLSDGVRPMIPLCLAKDVLSLRAGSKCATLSVAVVLEDEGSIAEVRIVRGWISPRYRLTYEDGDELIELEPPEDEDLAILAKLLKSRQKWRQRQGALQLEQAEGRFYVENEQPDLRIVEPSPSRQLVSEAMILMGAVIADFGKQHDLPLPYRSQAPSELPTTSELNQLTFGPIRNSAIKRCLSRGVLGTRPMPHFSLGLSAYVQASSPIRRYSDLLAHRQVVAQLEQQQPLSEHALMQYLDALNTPLKQAQQITREDQYLWQQVWFMNHRDQYWPAYFLRWIKHQDQLALVHVEQMAMDFVCRIKVQRDPLPGHPLTMIVLSVDPTSNELQLVAK